MYLKRYSAPKHWKVPTKAFTWVVRPSAGPHKAQLSFPLQVLIRDILKFADTAKEAQKIIKQGKVLVDKKERKDIKYPVGLMDLIDVPSLKKTYRVLPSRNGLVVAEVKHNENTKLCRINSKTTLKKGVFQLNLHDGKNILSSENIYKPGDSVLIELPGQKILKHFELKVGQPAYVISGKNSGFTGKLSDVKKRKSMREKSKIVLESEKERVETLKEYILVGDYDNN